MFSHNSQPRKRKRTESTESSDTPTKHRQSEANKLLDKLYEEANDLLDVVLACPIGASQLAEQKEKTLYDLVQEEEWLKRQLEVYKVALLKMQLKGE